MLSATPTLEHAWLTGLADSLAAPSDDPIAADPAQLMVAAGLDPDPWQRELLCSQWSRALLLCSRQAGKSTTTAALATWTAVYQPGSLTLLLSAAQRQSGELFQTVRHFYHAVPKAPPVRRESALQMELGNGSRIIALPGKEATIRGYSGVDLLVIDEAARVDDALYYSVRPMLAISHGRLVALSTPFGKRGFFHSEWTEGADNWHRVRITAHDVPRISPEFLEEERRALGPYWFSQEYECVFADTADQVFNYDIVMEAMDASIAPLFGGGKIGNVV